MHMNKTRYFRLGLFLITGGLAIVAAAILFGAQALFTDTIPAETYLAESVEGLDVGSPVKFRGVQIGSVASIGFVAQRYKDAPPMQRRYVMVGMELEKGRLAGLGEEDLDQVVAAAEEEGLRVRTTTQGLTGVSILQMDYIDPERNPPLPISWEPDNLYIPSAESTISRLEGSLINISKTMDSVARIDFEQLVSAINAILGQLAGSLQDANVASIGELLANNLEESQQLLGRMNTLMAAPEAERVIPDAAAAMESLRRIIEASEDDVELAMKELVTTAEAIGKTADHLDKVLSDPGFTEGISSLPDIMADVRTTASEFSKAAARLSGLIGALDDTLAEERGDVEAILNNLRQLTRNLERLSEEAAQNPSRVILGAPPRSNAPGVPAPGR